MPTAHIDVTDDNETSDVLTESVEQLRARLDAMKKLIDNPDKTANRRNQAGNTIIDGSFLNIVFTVVLLMIIGVSFYAFLNLYYAIIKKFHPKEHTEL
ncbi:uncharacterized protein LOC110832762 [Zootermopsis nevadensis]|uniref:Uncharacterized protein n=1 Tax=Zootermopsis nevadensis TaxID=136037 RepID=A0A067R0B5_ZOONE|nr:uncharacterized protein LOC110832762 [Zootermopsis nevadensis]KDR16156.1 hypothetical protein L798_09569 [Zootermopsis nevadensis]